MVYHNVAEIFDALKGTRDRLYQQVENLTRAQADFKTAPDAWSVAEILEHLNKDEQQMVKRLNSLLPAADTGNSNTVPVQFAPFSMDSYVAETRNRKLKSPEPLLPAGGLAIGELLQRLRASRDGLLTLRPRFESHDLSRLVGPHPAYGPINAYQGLASVGLHENRHLRQIETVMTSPGFPPA